MDDEQAQQQEGAQEGATTETTTEQATGVTAEALATIEAGEEAGKSTSVDFGDLDAANAAYIASQDVKEVPSAEARVPSGEDLGAEHSELGTNKEVAAAAEALAAEYRKLPGVVADLIGGSTVDEVNASLERSRTVYNTVKSQALQEAGEAVPAARGGPSNQGAPAPATPFDAIAAGLDAYDRRVKA